MTKTIHTLPDPILRRKSKPIKQVDKKLTRFITDLEDTLVKKENPSGVGLSAPQIGKSWRLMATFLPSGEIKDRPDLKGKKPILTTFINPKITKASKRLTLGPNKKEPILEGCLSVPDLFAPVYRHQWIKLDYSTLNPTTRALEKHSQKFSFFTARVIQHEIDHLDGILFTDRALGQNLPLYEERRGKMRQLDL